MVADIAPMLARLATALPPNDADYGFEFKWDGYRAVVYVDGDRVRVMSRGGQDYSHRFPELQGMGAAGLRGAVLDGEVIALGDDQGSSFQRLQGRSGAGTEEAVARRAAAQPVAYMVFDLLRLGGRSTMTLGYTERRARLESLDLEGAAWWVPPYQRGGGAEMFARSRELRREGVIAKRLSSAYVPGGRTGDWLKIKNQSRQELVIVGSVPGAGAREGRIGSLLVAYYDRRGRGARLVYAGKVGTGFTSRTLTELERTLAPIRRPTSPLDVGSPPRVASFVEPRLVCEVEFTEWTRDGTLRHPSFKGLRDDKQPAEVVREVPEAPTA
jgi:bifunctional non-homologous end joining protein LigD